MAYRVEYGSREAKRSEIRKKKSVGGKAWGFFLLFLLLVRLYWPAGTQVLRELLLPGASQTAFAEVQTLTQELREGEPFGQALENYCRRILAEAGVTHA